MLKRGVFLFLSFLVSVSTALADIYEGLVPAGKSVSVNCPVGTTSSVPVIVRASCEKEALPVTVECAGGYRAVVSGVDPHASEWGMGFREGEKGVSAIVLLPAGDRCRAVVENRVSQRIRLEAVRIFPSCVDFSGDWEGEAAAVFVCGDDKIASTTAASFNIEQHGCDVTIRFGGSGIKGYGKASVRSITAFHPAVVVQNGRDITVKEYENSASSALSLKDSTLSGGITGKFTGEFCRDGSCSQLDCSFAFEIKNAKRVR